jgi:hypothetical protein
MYKIAAIFSLILSILQVLVNKFQYYIIQDNSNITTGLFVIIEIILVLISCLMFLKIKKYKLNYYKSLLICSIIVIPFPFLLIINGSIMKQELIILNVKLVELATFYIFPFLCALIISAFFREKK